MKAPRAKNKAKTAFAIPLIAQNIDFAQLIIFQMAGISSPFILF
jgi:hypothetical protein